MSTTFLPARRMLLKAGLGSLALLATGCTERTPQGSASSGLFELAGPTMGTTYSVRIFAPGLGAEKLAAADEAVRAALDDVVRRMSSYDSESELSRLNRHNALTPFPVSAELLAVLATSQRVSELSQGAFDVTVAPAVDSWGFGPGHGRRVPSDAEIAALSPRVGYRMLSLDSHARTVRKARGDLRADLSGVAKGYGVDQAARALNALDIENYMVEAGGEIRTRGHNATHRPWQIGVERPDAYPQRAHLVVPLSGLAMATSGDYRIWFEQGGRRYSHEIDPATGRPIGDRVASVTVVAADCAYADAMATALIVMGADAGEALAEREGLAAYFIVREPGGTLAERQTAAFAALGGRPASRRA